MSDDSTQPTHHGYAVNVKDYHLYSDDRGTLRDDQVEAIYQGYVELFWMCAQEIARWYDFDGCYGVGRSGGWAQPYPQPLSLDDMYEDEAEQYIAAWLCNRFRPFERAILAEMASCRREYREALADAVRHAAVNPTTGEVV